MAQGKMLEEALPGVRSLHKASWPPPSCEGERMSCGPIDYLFLLRLTLRRGNEFADCALVNP